jgi:hypothetical protein
LCTYQASKEVIEDYCGWCIGTVQVYIYANLSVCLNKPLPAKVNLTKPLAQDGSPVAPIVAALLSETGTQFRALLVQKYKYWHLRNSMCPLWSPAWRDYPKGSDSARRLAVKLVVKFAVKSMCSFRSPAWRDYPKGSDSARRWRMLTYAEVCWRMQTYAHIWPRMLMYAHVCSRMLTHAHVCWCMLTHAHVC